MMTDSSADWIRMGDADANELSDCRLQLHWAVQPVMAFADCALERPADSRESAVRAFLSSAVRAGKSLLAESGHPME